MSFQIRSFSLTKPTFQNDAQRPYDQNGGSLAPRSLIFGPIAKETVYQKSAQFKRGAATTERAEEFPGPTKPHPITQG